MLVVVVGAVVTPATTKSNPRVFVPEKQCDRARSSKEVCQRDADKDMAKQQMQLPPYTQQFVWQANNLITDNSLHKLNVEAGNEFHWISTKDTLTYKRWRS
jgi:hypothetical protein